MSTNRRFIISLYLGCGNLKFFIMANISVVIPAENHTETVNVDLYKHSPVHVMFMAVKKGFEPTDGCIWKMTKSSGSNRDDIILFEHFKSLHDNEVYDGEEVILEEVSIL